MPEGAGQLGVTSFTVILDGRLLSREEERERESERESENDRL